MRKLLVSIGVFFVIFQCESVVADSIKEAPQLDSITVNGVERQWRMYVPPSYVSGAPMPLVLDFHGTGSSPHQQDALTEFEKLAQKQGFLVATPAAKYSREQDDRLTWNVDLHQNPVNDVEFVRLLVGHLSNLFTVDQARIYATGYSGGGRMSSRVACDLADLVAAIGPVAGIRYPKDCNPSRPVPVITFHGKKDNVNHYEHRPDSPPYWRMGVEQAILGWVGNNQCADLPARNPVTNAVTRISYSDCRGAADVVFYRSEDAGHTWPGSPLAGLLEEKGLGKTDMDVPATEIIWRFFEAHPLQGR